MKKFLTFLTQTALLLLFTVQAFGQKDIFKGIFEKEAPVFNAEIIPTKTEGEVLLVYYFSHSKLNSLETSIWIKDNGKNLMKDGQRKMVQDLKTIGNRQKDSLLIKGLQDNHFYSFGLDYKKDNAFNSRFVSTVLQEGYLYNFELNREQTVENILENKSNTPTNPCKNPDVFVRIESSGYCADNDRPAIIVECENCSKSDWKFSVELRTEYSTWETLRADGQAQHARGNARRTEPLCLLDPGAYYVRVLAWGLYCEAPIVYNVSNPIVISEVELKTGVAYNSENENIEVEPAPPLPDSCVVNGWGMLYGSFIQGTLQMKADSPCGEMAPYAKVTYIHPGHRNIVSAPIDLAPGKKLPFNIELDEKDLERGIHPIQVTVYIRPRPTAEEAIPISSFWIRAKGKGQTTEPSVEVLTEVPEKTEPKIEIDPDCTPLNSLQLVFASGDPSQPRYISWENPKCCQEENCSYFVWGGSNPVDLRLLSQGKSQGSVVRESLLEINPDDKYFEVVVSAKGGTRRASYVIGEGASYDEGIVEYDQQQGQLGQNEIIASRGLEMPASANLIPKRPLSDFGICKIYREVSMVGDFPLHEGDDVSISYDHSGSGYRYTLYHQPVGASDWLIAPGTVELQNSPKFVMTTSREHSGKYIVLVYKTSKKWGCLSASPEDSLQLKVLE